MIKQTNKTPEDAKQITQTINSYSSSINNGKYYCFFDAASEILRADYFEGTLDEPTVCFASAPVFFLRPNNEPTLLYTCVFSGVTVTEEPTLDDDGLSEHDTPETPPPSAVCIFRSRLLAPRKAVYDSPFL